MAGLARGDHGARASSRRARRPAPAGRSRAGASRRPRPAPAAAARRRCRRRRSSRRPTRPGSAPRANARPDRVRERVDRERLAADRRRLEQRQPASAALEPGRVGATIRWPSTQAGRPPMRRHGRHLRRARAPGQPSGSGATPAGSWAGRWPGARRRDGDRGRRRATGRHAAPGRAPLRRGVSARSRAPTHPRGSSATAAGVTGVQRR